MCLLVLCARFLGFGSWIKASRALGFSFCEGLGWRKLLIQKGG